MAEADEGRYETRIETNRWESFTRLTFVYFADDGYEVEQDLDFESGQYQLTFTDGDRGETAAFVYTGGPPDMATESLQQMQSLFAGTANVSQMWREMLE